MGNSIAAEEKVVLAALRDYKDLVVSVYEKHKGNVSDKPATLTVPRLELEAKVTDTPVKRKYKKRKYKKRESQPPDVNNKDGDYKTGVEKLKKENAQRVRSTSLLASTKFQYENIEKDIKDGTLNEADLKSAKRRRHYLAGKVEKLKKKIENDSDN